MKAKLTIVALLFLSIGLGVALFLLYTIRDKEQVKADQRRIELQTDRDQIRTTLDEQRKVNYSLESALTNRVERGANFVAVSLQLDPALVSLDLLLVANFVEKEQRHPEANAQE